MKILNVVFYYVVLLVIVFSALAAIVYLISGMRDQAINWTFIYLAASIEFHWLNSHAGVIKK